MLKIVTTSGRVRVIGEDRGDAVVEAPGPRRVLDGSEVRTTSKAVELRVPAGTDLVVGTASGTVLLEGPLGSTRVTTASGAITAEDVASIDARTTAGSIDVRARGEGRLRTSSSAVHVRGAARGLSVATTSGRVVVEDSRGPVSVRTVSGAVEIGVGAPAAVTVDTISGGVRVTVPPGVAVSSRFRSVSGRPHLECERGDDMELTVRTVSGGLSVANRPS